METNIPNLDTMDGDELMAFWFDHQGGRNSRRLFPEGGNGTRTATADLANYASNKAAAQTSRIFGVSDDALMYEGIADRIYSSLPEFARWRINLDRE